MMCNGERPAAIPVVRAVKTMTASGLMPAAKPITSTAIPSSGQRLMAPLRTCRRPPSCRSSPMSPHCKAHAPGGAANDSSSDLWTRSHQPAACPPPKEAPPAAAKVAGRFDAHPHLSTCKNRRDTPGLRARGFTLLELMLALVVVGTLATLAISSYSSYMEKARVAAAELDLSRIESRIETYEIAKSQLPSSLAQIGEG